MHPSQKPVQLQSDPPLVAPLADPALILRRQILVSGLFKYVCEVREIEDGYAFKFRRSQFLAHRLAEYLVFEGIYSPQLSFVLIVEANGGSFWMQVSGPGATNPRIRSEYMPPWLSWNQD